MKAIIIYQGGKPVLAYAVKELTSSEFLAVEKECKKNLDEILLVKEKEKNELIERVDNLEHEIKILKGEE